jgi:hypothetical protein
MTNYLYRLNLCYHISKKTNLEFWKPNRNIIIDELILRYISRAKEITTISNKLIPTSLKVWNSAQRDFIIAWC